MVTDSNLNVGEIDVVGNDYNIYVTLKDGSKILYNPSDWDFNQLVFESENPDLVSVDKLGNLTSYNFEVCNDENEEPIDTAYAQTRIIIRSTDAENGDPYGWFDVQVRKMDSLKIGFCNTDEPSLVDISKLLNCSCNDKHYSVVNPLSSSYLWVLSKRKIQYIKSVDETESQLSELSSGFRVPMIEYNSPINGYFYYHSTAPILYGKMNVKIKFA